VITKRNLPRLEKYNKLAPLHNPANLEGIKACLKLLPGVPNIAVFDTSFHRTMPEKVYRYGLPEKYYRRYGIRRYGFHGISYQYVIKQALEKLNLVGDSARFVGKQGILGGRKSSDRKSAAKIIICHLGGGSSVTATRGGRSVDISMGFTPLEGLLMMSRAGDLDPGVILYLQRELKMSAAEIDQLLNKKSGVYGLTGEKDWLTVLQKMRRGNKQAKLAFEMFCHRARKYIGAYYAILGGLDALIFTGAIGAGNPTTRRRICAGLPFLKGVKVLAIKTDEERAIAGEVVKYF